MKSIYHQGYVCLLALAALTVKLQGAEVPPAQARPTPTPDYPPYTEVIKDYKQVVSTIDQSPSLFGLFVNTTFM